MRKIYLSIFWVLFAFALSAQQWSWVQALPGNYGAHMDEDMQGNIYVSSQLASAPDTTMIEKMDSAGTVIWTKKIACTVNDVKVSSTRVYFAGGFSGSAIFDGSAVSATGGGDAFLACYDLAGNYQWLKRSTGAGTSAVTDMTLTNMEEPIVGIQADSVKNFGSVSYGKGAAVVTVNSSGVVTNSLVISGSAYSLKITRDYSDNIYLLGGYKDSTMVVGTVTLTCSNTYYGSYFFAKLHSNGTVYWAKDMGTRFNHSINQVCVGASGNIFLPETFTYSQGNLIKLNANGVQLWSQPFGSNPYAEVYDAKIDAWENLTMTGVMWGSANFGSCFVNGNQYFLYVAKVDSSGSCQWVKTGQSNDEAAGMELSIKTSHTMMLGWDFNGAMVQLPPLSVQGYYYLGKISGSITAIASGINGTSFRIVPSPNDGLMTLHGMTGEKKIRVYDMPGNLIYSMVADDEIVSLDLRVFAAGIYRVECVSGNERHQEKIVVAK